MEGENQAVLAVLRSVPALSGGNHGSAFVYHKGNLQHKPDQPDVSVPVVFPPLCWSPGSALRAEHAGSAGSHQSLSSARPEDETSATSSVINTSAASSHFGQLIHV